MRQHGGGVVVFWSKPGKALAAGYDAIKPRRGLQIFNNHFLKSCSSIASFTLQSAKVYLKTKLALRGVKDYISHDATAARNEELIVFLEKDSFFFLLF